MAAVSAQENSDIQEITCAICNDVYTNARDLSCGHTFCLCCLQHRVERKCPVCDEENIPEESQMNELTVNRDKNNLVGVEMTRRSNV